MSTYSPEISTYEELDLGFASRAVVYLEKSGLDADEVVDCLMDEFDLDRETAVELASWLREPLSRGL